MLGLTEQTAPLPTLGWWSGPALPEAGSQAPVASPWRPRVLHGPPGPFTMPGTSEHNSAVQVLPTPAALVPYFQVLFLYFLKVLQ